MGFDKEWVNNKSIDNAIEIYRKICDWYKEYKESDEFRENIFRFNQYFTEYKSISDVKKIDYLLWCL